MPPKGGIRRARKRAFIKATAMPSHQTPPVGGVAKLVSFAPNYICVHLRFTYFSGMG